MKGATKGFVAGTIYGTIVATWYDVPRVEKNIALPGLLRTLRMMGSCGMTFAAIGGVYIGVEQLLQDYRMKRIGGCNDKDKILAWPQINGGGHDARNISTEICAGAAFAVTCSLIDIEGQTTRIGEEYIILTRLRKGPELIHEQCLPSEMEKLGLMGYSSDLFMIL